MKSCQMYRFIPIMLLCVCLFTGGCSKIRELHRRFLPVAKAEELADGASSDLDIISSVYNYIIISLHILPMIIPKLPV